MILRIKQPTHIFGYRLSPRARERATLNLVRRRRNLYDQAGIRIDKIIIIRERKQGTFFL